MGESIELASLEPATQSRCRDHIRIAKSVGLHTLLTCGSRSNSQQMDEFKKGRQQLPSGIWIVVGKTVTNARPKDAPHCRKAAYDLWLLWPSHQQGVEGAPPFRLASMDEADGWSSEEVQAQFKDFTRLVEIGKGLGMASGSEWIHRKDWPHFERPDWKSLPWRDDP